MKLLRPIAKFSSDQGSAAIEFIGLGVLIQLGLLAFGAQLIQVQHNQLAAESMVRNGLRSFTLTGKSPTQTAGEIAAAYGIPASKIVMAVNCGAADCAVQGSWMKFLVTIDQSSAVGVAQK